MRARIAGRLAARRGPGQGRLPRPRRPLGADAAPRARGPPRRRSGWRGCCRSTSATSSAPTAPSSAPGAASCRSSLRDFTVLAKTLRPPPEKHHGLADVETRFRFRELDLMSNEEARGALRSRARASSPRCAASSTRRASSRSRRRCSSRSTAAPRHAFTTHHNVLDHDLYLRIATELYLKRLHRRRPRARLRDRQELPQRGRLLQAQPRVHRARVVRGLRGLRRRREPLRAARRLRCAEAAATPARSTSRRPGGGRRCATRSRRRTGIDVARGARPRRRWRRTCRAATSPIPEEDTWGQLVDHLLSKYVEPEPSSSPRSSFDYPVELSPLRQAPPRQGRPRRALRGLRARDGVRQRLHRAQRPRRPAGALRAAAPLRRGGRRGGPALRRGRTSRRSSTACRPRAGSASASTAW